MKPADDDLMTWTFDGQRIACTMEKAREMLWVAHPVGLMIRSKRSFSLAPADPRG
jgi:hypothetical protein